MSCRKCLVEKYYVAKNGQREGDAEKGTGKEGSRNVKGMLGSKAA